MKFREKLTRVSQQTNSLVCVGLDTDPDRLPEHLTGQADSMYRFNEAIIAATSDRVCAYKPNSAFYEALGESGITILRRTCEAIPSHIPVILDVKRGDIANTAEKYAVYAYDVIGADAVTVNPYMGFDAVRPFLREGKCVFILCATSNTSAADFQLMESNGVPLYEQVARAAVSWSQEGEVGLVVGGTNPGIMGKIRAIAPDLSLLVPGVGAQGGDIAAVVEECGGEPGFTVINSSRGILYASNGPDFAEAARASLEKLRTTINGFRE